MRKRKERNRGLVLKEKRDPGGLGNGS